MTPGQVKLPKIKLSKIDWSKWNFRKVNAVTILAIMAYLGPLIIIPLMINSKRTFVRYHIGQGLSLLVVWVLFAFSFYFPALPFIFAFYIVISMIIGIVNVLMGHERPVPLVGRFAK